MFGIRKKNHKESIKYVNENEKEGFDMNGIFKEVFTEIANADEIDGLPVFKDTITVMVSSGYEPGFNMGVYHDFPKRYADYIVTHLAWNYPRIIKDDGTKCDMCAPIYYIEPNNKKET